MIAENRSRTYSFGSWVQRVTLLNLFFLIITSYIKVYLYLQKKKNVYTYHYIKLYNFIMLIYDIRSVFFFTYLNGFEPLTNCLTGNCSTIELQVFNILIQPQIPLRLPCYDFTLITNPTMINNNNIVRKLIF